MFEIKFTGNNFLSVRTEIQEFAINHLNMKFGVAVDSAQVAAHTAPAVVVEEPKKAKAPKKPIPEPAATTAFQQPVAASTNAVAGPSESLTHPDCVGALEKVYNKFGMEKSLEILSRFGVKRARELKEPQYKQFVDLCHQTAGA